MPACGAQPSPPGTPATVFYLIPLRTPPGGRLSRQPMPRSRHREIAADQPDLL